MKRMACLLVVLSLVLCLSSAWAAKKEISLATFSEMTTKKLGPKPRIMSAAFFRNKGNQLLICGGGLETLNPQGDLWALDLKTREWSKIKPANGDLQKIAMAAGIYDEKRDRLVVIVQEISGKLETFSYSFAENKWNSVAPVGDFPKVMFRTTPIYDPKADSIVVFGGSAWENPDNTHYRTVYYKDLYSLSLKDLKWKKLAATGESPLPRSGQVEIYDPKTHSLVMYGGIGTDKTGKELVFNDVWVLDLTKLQWKKVEAKGIKIEPRCSHCGVYDPVKHRMIVFGGGAMMDKQFSDLLALDLDTYTWSRVRTKLPVTLQLSGAAAAWDSNANRMLVFGGIQPGRIMMNAVWEIAQK
ncbi:MAG TPA: kelch repeat-containing protein [bacterium]|nr:kelch repeat-containing protein [bacterium]